MAEFDVDLFVIGGGSGGVRAARIAAGHGARVMIAEEYRMGGKLYMLKVTPARGAPSYLIDEKGDGRMTRQDSFDSGVRPPMWVIHSW